MDAVFNYAFWMLIIISCHWARGCHFGVVTEKELYGKRRTASTVSLARRSEGANANNDSN
jgi:hypothetical protein